jgi:hypothetical protein
MGRFVDGKPKVFITKTVQLFQPDAPDRGRSRRSLDKEKQIPRKLVKKTDETGNPAEKPVLTGSSAAAVASASSTTSQSMLSFDRLIPRSGEAVNRKRLPGNRRHDIQDNDI